MTHVLLIGNGAREHAIAEAIRRSAQTPRLYSFMKTNNPGIASLSEKICLGRYDEPEAIVAFARDASVAFAIVGPEDPLSQGVVDALTAAGIPAVGPTRSLARLETSKSFTRNLLEKYDIPGNPRFRNFTSLDGIDVFLGELDGIVLKPDGLTGGKGVLVQGDHFQTRAEALEHCRDIFRIHPGITVEEKLEGEEFSLQCLSDGRTVVPTPPVQDHKRRFIGDSGPNTGGMGSYSCADHLLPFLDADDVAEGLAITRKVAEAIRLETGIPYKGVLYGGFMLTRTGVKLIEYNARFGDPEAMNILPLLLTDFIDVCRAIIDGTLDRLDIVFEKKATVCKYIVPKGYGLPEDHPDASFRSSLIMIGDVQTARLYYSSIDQRSDGLYMTPSRAIGVVGIADGLAEAERIAERAVAGVYGPVDHRPDIGTEPLIRKRVQHMKKLKADQYKQEGCMQQNDIKRVLISVTDKTGIVEFARGLRTFGVEILSTGGTAAQLRNSGIPVIDVSDYTGFPEMMDGRLKTLHPKIHGGLLALRDNQGHMNALREHGINLIDMVVINLYRFEDTVAKEGCTLEHAIENIDIGGPTMLRAASKNYRFVSVVTDPEDYPKILAEMKERGGKISEATNFELAKKTFQLTARYDGAISNYLGMLSAGSPEKRAFPDTFSCQFAKAQDLRYGENPHQKAAFYREKDPQLSALSNARQLQGKELSYNNIMDSDAAWQVVSDIPLPGVVIIKHANPCGAATSDGDMAEAFRKALAGDPVSAFGGIVALNRRVDKKAAEELVKTFFEVIIAPGFAVDALELLETRKNVRVLEVPAACSKRSSGYEFRRVMGGLLIQDRDMDEFDIRKAKVVTKRIPTEAEYQALDFAWRVVKHVKSNAIVYTTKDQLVGMGAGQTSRVDSVKIAKMKAILPTEGCVLGSDAFFPFRDGIDMAAQAGITAIIEPGGSIKDDETIRAADEHGITMIFTGIRHFKH